MGVSWAKRMEGGEPNKTKEWKEISMAGVEHKKGSGKGGWIQRPGQEFEVYPSSNGKALEDFK